MDHLTGQTVVLLMRAHGKTIRGIARRLDVTLKRVRHVRAHGVEGRVFVMDWMESITGNPMAGWDIVAGVYAGRRKLPAVHARTETQVISNGCDARLESETV